MNSTHSNSISPRSVPSAADHEVTGILEDWQAGDPEAWERLTPLVYCRLKRLAGGHLRGERPDHSLQPTDLVHEVFLRLIEHKRGRWENRAQFFAVASCLMRRILVDHARRRLAKKRGGATATIGLDEKTLAAAVEGDLDLIHLDDALRDLAKLDARKSRAIEMRFFGGFTIEETAEALQISPATVKSDWQTAKAWLFGRLRGR